MHIAGTRRCAKGPGCDLLDGFPSKGAHPLCACAAVYLSPSGRVGGPGLVLGFGQRSVIIVHSSTESSIVATTARGRSATGIDL